MSSADGAFDWRRVLGLAWRLAPAGAFVAYAFWLGGWYQRHPETLWSDVDVYFRATQAWVTGGNPWSAVNDFGVRFAAPAPALLLNLPLLPFGEGVARVFWAIAGAIGIVAAIRHYRLPAWWIAFPPFIQGWLAGSADPALMGLVVVGGGAFAALTKPYAVPAMLGEARYRALGLALLLLVVTAPFLPWQAFIQSVPEIAATLADQAPSRGGVTGPAWLIVAAAVVSLGRRGFLVATPALWPNAQLHYALFSLAIAKASPLLAIGFAIPGMAPLAVVAFAGGEMVRHRFGKRPGPAPADGATFTDRSPRE